VVRIVGGNADGKKEGVACTLLKGWGTSGVRARGGELTKSESLM